MAYWIVEKIVNKKFYYLSGIDKNNNPIHTEDESKACRFYDFGCAMHWFNRGYCIAKKY